MKLTPSPQSTLEDRMICEATEHFHAAESAVRKGCEHAILAGMRLIWLHQNTVGDGHGGDRRSSVSRDTLENGFIGACEKIGIHVRTAYRWINATQKAALRACLAMDSDDMAEVFPTPDDPRWAKWETALKDIAQSVSLNRLMIGGTHKPTEIERYDYLIYREENGSSQAITLLAGVEEGRYTLVQAVRALGSREAYEKLMEAGGEKMRKDPVYLIYDGEARKLEGLLPRAFVTLQNGCKQWDTFTDAERHALRAMWQDIRATLPDELFTSRKP